MNTNGNQTNGNEIFTPSTRSAYRFFNSNSKVDKTSLSFIYWNSLLKITMNPIITQEGSANKVDTNNHIDIYLSPSKAQMLLNCIQQFRANPGMYDNIGVPTNRGVILIADGNKMFNTNGTFIVINLINEDGSKEGEAAYEINSDLTGIKNYSDSGNFESYTDYSTSIELDMIETLLRSFIEAYTNAIASSILECNKINDNRMFNFIKDAKEKLGISKESGSSKYGKSSWYNNNGGTSVSSDSPKSNSAEYEEVMNDIASLMD